MISDLTRLAPARLYLRRDGSFGSSCAGVLDTGHRIHEDSGRFTVWSGRDMEEDRKICENATRDETETAIAKDWDQ